MASKIPNTVCSAPWSHFAIGSHPDGFITTPCCRFRMGSDSRWNKQKFQQPAQAISKNGYLEDIRQKMLSGERLRECEKCWREERDKGYSMRNTMLKRMSLDEIEQNVETFKLKYLEVMFSNLCNLSCRMCDITQSSQWANLYNNAFVPANVQDEQSVPDHFLEKNGRAKTQPISFHSDLIKDIDMSELVEVKILGGEPMMTPDHLLFLEKLMHDSKDPSKIKLVYHTNGTKRPPQKVVDYWKQMQSIEIVLSIDGYADVNEYQRIGHTWKTIEENIEWYSTLGNNIHMRVHTTLSIINIWQIDLLCKWLEDYMTQFLPWYNKEEGLFAPLQKVITFDFVQKPAHLDLTIMPDTIKNRCINTVNSAKYLTDTMKKYIIKYIKSSSCNPELWKEFWMKMEMIDAYTKQSLSNIIPNIEELKN